MSFVRAHLVLIKWRIALFASMAAGLGHLLGSGEPSRPMLFTMAGVFMLASGAGALNQYQERELDARMERTMNRPIPAGVISPCEALTVSMMFIVYGLALLVLWCGVQAMALGLFAVLWYNIIYTPLKRLTAFAAVPGALVGAIPPVIGWAGAGGSITDLRILSVAFFFFIWQVPHFWLMLLKHGPDYGRAGFPTMKGMLTRAQLGRITFVWTAAAASASLLVPLFGNHIHPLFTVSLCVLAVWLVLSGRGLLSVEAKGFPPVRITLFMLLSMTFLSAGTILS